MYKLRVKKINRKQVSKKWLNKEAAKKHQDYPIISNSKNPNFRLHVRINCTTEKKYAVYFKEHKRYIVIDAKIEVVEGRVLHLDPSKPLNNPDLRAAMAELGVKDLAAEERFIDNIEQVFHVRVVRTRGDEASHLFLTYEFDVLEFYDCQEEIEDNFSCTELTLGHFLETLDT